MSEQTSANVSSRTRAVNDERDDLDQRLREIVANAARAETLEEGAEQILEQLDGMPHLNERFRQKAAHWMLADARNNLRQKIERQSVWSVPENAAKLSDARLAARVSLYDYPLPGCDVRLGDATVDDLALAVTYHEARAASEQARGAIYRQVADMLRRSRKRTVREGVREDRIAEIMRGAQ